MEKLIATYPILYLSKQYEIGDELPANDPKMVDAWLEAETAVWKSTHSDTEEDSDTEDAEGSADVDEELPPAFATAVSAEAGVEGSAVNAETEDNLVGKVPKTPTRNRK